MTCAFDICVLLTSSHAMCFMDILHPVRVSFRRRLFDVLVPGSADQSGIDLIKK